MVDVANVHDTSVILLERFKRLNPSGLELCVLRKLNDMNRLCTGVNVERCGDAAMKDLEWLRLNLQNELGNVFDDDRLRAVLKEIVKIQKGTVPPWS